MPKWIPGRCSLLACMVLSCSGQAVSLAFKAPPEPPTSVISFNYNSLLVPAIIVQISINGKPPSPSTVDTSADNVLVIEKWAEDQLNSPIHKTFKWFPCCRRDAEPIRIPFQLKGEQIYVKVLAGHRTIEAMVDTGTSEILWKRSLHIRGKASKLIRYTFHDTLGHKSKGSVYNGPGNSDTKRDANTLDH